MPARFFFRHQCRQLVQLLCVHVDSFGFEASNPDPAVETAGDPTEADLAAAVVVFVGVERRDTDTAATTAHEAVDVIGEVTEQLDTDRVALVPCRQLTDSPARREDAVAVIDTLSARLREPARVPVGWDVAIDVQTKAHPFAVQHYHVEPATDTVDSEWFRYSDGSLSPESAGADVAAVGDAGEVTGPDPVETGRRFGLFATDGDTTSLLPRGVLARDRLERDVSASLSAYGAVPVDRLGAGDGAVFHSWSGDGLPRRLFEIRSEPSEPADADRELPAATAPTLSVAVDDLPAAFAEACEQAALADRLLSGLELTYDPVLRVHADVLATHRGAVTALAALFGRPVPVERRSTAEWLVRIEFHAPSAARPVTTPAVVVDRPADGSTVVRSLPAGALERTLGAVLAASDPARLPLWLAPVQLRLIPIDPAAHLAYCEQLADRLEAASVRVDIDDRDTAVRERRTAADEAGIPYYAVIGDDELGADSIGVTVRREGREPELSPAKLEQLLTDDRPAQPDGSLLPRYVSDLGPVV